MSARGRDRVVWRGGEVRRRCCPTLRCAPCRQQTSETLSASPTPTATRSGSWSGTPDTRSAWPDTRSAGPDTTWRPWSPDTRRADTRRARNRDIEIEIEIDVDDIRHPNRKPRIDVHGRRRR
jgi:hypothetical protein